MDFDYSSAYSFLDVTEVFKALAIGILVVAVIVLIIYIAAAIRISRRGGSGLGFFFFGYFYILCSRTATEWRGFDKIHALLAMFFGLGIGLPIYILSMLRK